MESPRARALAGHDDPGRVDYKAVAARYGNFCHIWEKAFVGVPKVPFHIDKDFIGSMEDAGELQAAAGSVPVVIHAHGSGPFADQVFQESLAAAGYLFIALNSHAVSGRPTYEMPAPAKADYESVHTFRQAEIGFAAEKVLGLGFVDRKNMFLMGSSEGGLATARYSGREFKGRVVMGWSCEAGYYTDYPKIGARPEDPFLNIVGYHDEYFGVEASSGRGQARTGNCGRTLALGRFENSKVIIYPEGRHNNRNSRYILSDVIGFLDYWKDRPAGRSIGEAVAASR
jgi:dienelactone hydrolase